MSVSRRLKARARPRRRYDRRRKRPRARVMSMDQLEHMAEPALRFVPRPRRRADCLAGPRPCPFVSCRYHLWCDPARRQGALLVNFPDLEPWELPATCALDLADCGASTLEAVGVVMNMTRERVRQVEERALRRLRSAVATLTG